MIRTFAPGLPERLGGFPPSHLRTTRVSESGMSLVEVTIILVVLSSLAAMLAPTARAYMEDGRNVKAAKDVQAIGAAITEVLSNTSLLCLSLSAGSGAPCDTSATGRADLLVSGSDVAAAGSEPTVVTAAYTPPAGSTFQTPINWAGSSDEIVTRRDTMDKHFVTNGVSYSVPTFTAGGGPRSSIGWRGPYVTGGIDLDPWGYVYQANVVFVAVASNATDGTGEGQKRGGWTRDVLVISAGSNGTLQTAFGGTATTGVGDDVLYLVQGGTH
jgi:type II secretory pathway pseudopilin PulG